MTGFLHEKEFSRRQFVKGGGALIVGFSLLGSSVVGKASAADSPFASNGPGDMYQVDAWIVINADNTASIKSGSIFQGTGSTTGVLMIAAEELDMDFSQVSHVQSDTNVTPETGAKSASTTIVHAGPGVRAAAAHARQVLLGLAATRLGVSVSSLSVSKGVVSGGGKSVSYGDLLGGKLFNVRMPDSYNMVATDSGPFGFNGGIQPGQGPAKPVSQYTLVGRQSPPRVDIPGIVMGTTTYIQNVRVPGMLHGRVVLPRGQAVYGFGAPVISVDESSIKHLPNVRIVRQGDFLGVVAPHEYDAIQAAAQLKVKWADPPAVLPGGGDEFAQMRALDAAGKTIVSNVDYKHLAPNAGDVDKALAQAAHTVSGTYGWPTNVHSPIGPNCAVADVTPEGARILAGTQGVYDTRDKVAPVLGLPLNKVRVTGFPFGAAYGSAPYDDAAQAAAIMSQAVGAPVRVQYMRWDEIGWGHTAPGTLMDIRAGIDGNGNIIAFDYSHIYPQYLDNGITPLELIGGTPAPPSMTGNVYPGTMYNIPNNRYTVKSIPLEGNWVKAVWMRHGSIPAGIFTGEQVTDELARAAKMDPVAFRIQNVTQNNQWRQTLLEVLNAVTKAANWQPRVAASQISNDNVVRGRGIAWANSVISSPSATVADVEVNRKTGKIAVKHIYQAFSAGLSVYPGGVENQMVGGITQILSRLLVEQFRFSKTHVVSSDFVSYPILRFKDAAKITPIVIQRMNDKSSGVGQEITDSVPAAVANAFFDATGVRMRTAPFTPARVRAALKAAGVA